MRYRMKKVNNMNNTMAMERLSLKQFIKQNKEKVYSVAEQNTVRNSKGQTTISKDDPWFYEDEWDEHSKRMDSK